MSTCSVPLTAQQIERMQSLITQGIATNKADLMRKALDKYIEDQAVEAVLKAMKEPRLKGDLDELAANLYD